MNNELITYLGNKRKLIPFIEQEISTIYNEFGKELTIIEPFCGSGSVSQMLKKYSKSLYVNDLESFCCCLARCYLSSPSKKQFKIIQDAIHYANNHKFLENIPSFIRKHYAPKNDDHILKGERAYYTSYNAHIIDSICYLSNHYFDASLKDYIIAPLLVKASIHTNTSGTFNSYHKKNGIGHWGGKGEHALSRIKGEIKLDIPQFNIKKSFELVVENKDANEWIHHLVNEKKWFDIAYLDPPYNKHPYGTNFFMLDMIYQWDPNRIIPDNHRGQPTHWKRSKYNSFSEAVKVFEDLIATIPATYVLLSYNNEGIIPQETIQKILEKYGTVTKKEMNYPTFKACKNLSSRNKSVIECLWILKKK